VKFSIIVPVYNGAENLRFCVESVQKQSVSDWQLILVDDGSADDSFRVMQELRQKDERILTIQQENMGPFFARKNGIAHADGDYLLFLDCDDTLEEECLKKLYRVITEQHADVICYTACSEGKSIGTMEREEGILNKQDFCRELLGSHQFNAVWCKAFRRELFYADENNYEDFRGICWGEDKALFLHGIHRAKQIYYLPDSLYHYRRNPKGISKISSPTQIDAMVSAPLFRLMEKYRSLWNVEERVLKTYQLRNLLNTYWRSCRSCRTKEDQKLFGSYPWKKHYLPLKMYREGLNKKEKLKLLLAWRLYWRG